MSLLLSSTWCEHPCGSAVTLSGEVDVPVVQVVDVGVVQLLDRVAVSCGSVGRKAA